MSLSLSAAELRRGHTRVLVRLRARHTFRYEKGAVTHARVFDEPNQSPEGRVAHTVSLLASKESSYTDTRLFKGYSCIANKFVTLKANPPVIVVQSLEYVYKCSFTGIHQT